MIERVTIDSEEDGFHLILHGEIEVEPSLVEDDQGVFVVRSPANFRLSQDAAWQLVDAVRPVAEWRAEGEAVRADHERYKRTGELPDYLPPVTDPDLLAEMEHDRVADDARNVHATSERKRRER